MKYCPFVVNDKPFCVWEWDLDNRNLEFLNSIDPDYFSFIAQQNVDLLDGEHAQRAAIAIRTSYHHGLETLFAILFAVIQAPSAIPAWLRKYQTHQLRDLVSKASGKQHTILNRLGIDHPNWDKIASVVIAVRYDCEVKTKETKQSFGFIWNRFANDYLDQQQQAEYNSIKHGFRVRAGGVHLSVGEESEPGAAVSPEKMKHIGGSDYGTAFFEPELPEGADAKTGSANFRIRKHHLNWDPMMIALRLQLISMSISNVISFAKILNGVDPKTAKFLRPVDSTEFMRPWSQSVGINSFNVDKVININEVRPLSANEILSSYDQSAD